MKNAYQRLKKLNESYKNSTYKFSIKKVDTDYFIYGLKITSYDKIYEIIQTYGCYINNLSMLAKVNRIIGKYELKEEDWFEIKLRLTTQRLYRSFSIIKVENMEEYISKAIILKGFSSKQRN